MLLAQLLLRPIHVIRSGLTRLGKGEFGVRLDLDQDDEFGELGTFFNTVSAQLSADRSHMAGQVANLESAVEHLEDAVAIVSPGGEFLFANPAMRALVPNAAVGRALNDVVAGGQPIRHLFEQTLASRQAARAARERRAPDARRIPVNDAAGELVGIMVIARNLEYLSQVQSTIRYSRKLAALGRLSAGVAHEVKNPLNAMMIHLELLRQQCQARATGPEAIEHVDMIASEIRRLDEVVQGFLKFTRPEDLKLQPVRLKALFDEVVPIVRPEAERTGVHLVVECDVARCQRRSGDAAAGVSEPRAERLSGDAERRHAAHPVRSGARTTACAITFPTPASASSPSTCSASSICISRPSRKAAASACRWCIARFRCMTARLRYSRLQGQARRSSSPAASMMEDNTRTRWVQDNG